MMLQKIIFAFSLFFLPLWASAASMTLEANPNSVGEGALVSVVVLVNSVAPVNAFSGTLVYSQNLEPVSVNDGSSIVSVWVVHPEVQTAGTIAFAGLTPGGYAGSEGKILQILFRAKKNGKASVSLKDVEVLRNDGAGTREITTTAPLSISISSALEGGFVEATDSDPPEPFGVYRGEDEALFQSRSYIVFAAVDKISGIDHYEVAESRVPLWIQSPKWVRAESPYLLVDQALTRTVYVKAVDRAGNVQIGIFPREHVLSTFEAVTVLGIVVLLLGIWFLWHMRKKTVLLLFAFFFLPHSLFAATLSLSPSSVSVSVGDIVTERVIVSADTAINAVSGTLTFSPDLLSVSSVSKASSVLTLWVQEPAFSNGEGNISFSGVVPNPGFTGTGNVLTIQFRAKKTGTVNLAFASSAVLANDGNGTNVLTSARPAVVTITTAVAPVQTAPKPSVEQPATPTGIESPKIDHISDISVGKLLYISGRTYPGAQVTVYVDGPGGVTSQEIRADNDGNFKLTWKKQLLPGVYSAWAKAVDVWGAISPNSIPSNFQVKDTTLFIVGGIAFTSSMLFGLVLLFCILIILVAWYFGYRLKDFKRVAFGRLRTTHSLLHQQFSELREAVVEEVMALEKVKSKRVLTTEEERIITRLKKLLDKAEHTLEKEIDKVVKS